MPIQFDPNNPIPDEFQPEKPSKKPAAQQPKAQAPKSPQQTKQQNQPDFQDIVDSVPGLREAAGTLLNIPGAIADQVPSPLDLLPKPVEDAIKTSIQGIGAAANPAAGISRFMAGTALQGDKAPEAAKAIAGAPIDLAEGVLNLPTQIVQGITGKPWYRPINTGLIPENNTTAGQGLRTLARYAFAASVPVPGLSGASGLGLKAVGQRAAEGFVQDFAAASGEGDEGTFIGNIPGLRALQTNEAYSPLLNRAVVGLEGALFNAGFGEAGEALQRLLARKKAGRPIIGDPQAQADLNLVNSVGPTMKYGGNPNELVVDGLKAATQKPEATNPLVFYHGTTDANAASIRSEGFRPSGMRGDVGNALGDGVFFTTNPKYAADYGASLLSGDPAAAGLKIKTITDQDFQALIEEKYGGFDQFDFLKDQQALVKEFGSEFDGVRVVGDFGGLGSNAGDEIVVFDPKKADSLIAAPSSQGSLPTVPFTSATSPTQAGVTPQAASAPVAFKPVDMSSKNIQSINFENANGQPGFDLWFADKRFPALLPGTVKKVGKQGSRGRGYGNYIVVESIDPKTGDKVDVLYAHLADGGIKVKEGDSVVPGMELGTQGGTGRVVSSDGTIASVDFLAPAAKESKSMKPYKRFNELRRELAEQIGKGGITPGQAQQVMADVAAAVPTGQANEAIQEASEQLEALTRREALDAGYEVSELVPVAARNDVNDVAAEMIKRGPDISVENTARPAVFSLTDNEIRAIGGSSEQALKWANSLAETVDYEKVKALSGTGDIDIEGIRENVRTQFKDILDMSDEDFGNFVGQITTTDKQGRTTVTDEGIFALTFKLNELASQTSDLAKAAENAEINGQNPQLLYLRAIDRGMAMMQLEKVANSADSWNLSRRGALRNEDTVLTQAAQEQITANKEAQAMRDTRLSLMKEARDAILRGDEAWLEKLPAALRALQMVGANPKEQLNVWKTLSASVLKTGDAAFTGSVLTGPATQSINFQSVLFNSFGHPALTYLSKVMPGPENKAIREEAVAAMSATMDTVRELNSLIPKLWSNQANTPEMLGREFVGLDDVASRNLQRIKAMKEAGELSDGQLAFYNLATYIHDLVQAPWWTGTVRRAIGTFDNIADVIAGRQTAYRKAYLDALAIMGDAPITPAYKEKFSRIIEQQRKQHLKSIFDEDGITLIDDEAKQLSDAFAFRTDVENLDKFTKSMISMAEIPGMKMLGLTFVRSPAAMMKAMTRFTPGLSNVLMKYDKAYKEGTPYMKAYIEGANAVGWFLGMGSFVGGLTGVQTGAGPLRGQERDSWSENNEAFTMKLPYGAQFKYQWVEPVSTIMGFFADLGYYARFGAEQATEDNFARGMAYMLARVFPAAGSNVINKSYFTQLATISKLTDLGNVSSYKKLGENITSGLVPLAGLRNQLGGVADPLYRELRSELNNTFSWFIEKKGGLGLSRFAPEDLDDVTGKPLYKNGVDGDAQSSLLQAFNLFRPLGVTVSKNRFKPVHKYLTEVGIDVADSRDKILGTPLTNEERTEFTRYMTKGGAFEKELLRYFKSDAYKFDKDESARQLQQGFKPSETVAYQQVNKIIANFTQLAMYEMGKGLTTTSVGFINRRSQDLNQARQQAFERQQRQIQNLRQYPFP